MGISPSQTYGEISAPYESQFLLFLNDHCEAGDYHCSFPEFISAVTTYLYTQNRTIGFDDANTMLIAIKCLIGKANTQGYSIRFGGIVCRKNPAEYVFLTGIRLKSFPKVHESLSSVIMNYRF